MPDNDQLKEWAGKLGNEYITRNNFASWKLPIGRRAFEQMLNGLDIGSVLEIGANIGLNLHYIKNGIMRKNIKKYAIEPNKEAFDILCSDNNLNLEQAWNQDASEIPLADSSMDLVFTSGVLIHVAPENLEQITDEIVRVTKKYVLCIEYFSHKPTSIKYHNQENLLFKRDFGGYYLDRFPELKCIRYGFLWQREYKIFDDLNWWLFIKKEH